MKKVIPMAQPDITEAEEKAVVEVLRSKRLALGPKIKEFEQQFADYTGRKHAIATSSGTAGLHLAMLACGIGPGDEVMVPSYTFVASVNCILYVGATPVFVDVDPDHYCVSLEDMQKKWTNKTKAVVAVDVFGHPAPLHELEKFCKEKNMFLIDDSCEGIGAEIAGKRVGAYGDIASFAFYPNKQITTGEGGMLVMDDDELARKCRMYLNQGRDSMSQWLEHPVLGYNYRMSDVSAAIGVEQMKRVDSILQKRENVANYYCELLSDNPHVQVQKIHKEAKMSWFVFVITLTGEHQRDEVIQQMQDENIPARAYFTPIHTQPYLKNYPTRGEDHLPVTMDIGNRTIALPFYGEMPKDECEYVIDTLNRIIGFDSKKKAA